MLTRRTVIAASAAIGTTGFAPAGLAAAIQSRSFTPEQFGAKGDGRTNDSAAMARLADAVNRAGGGTVTFRRATYIVGRQEPRTDGKYAFMPLSLLGFSRCTGPLTLHGNGARLKASDGALYGVFGPRGNAIRTAMPYLGDGLATPYFAMMEVADCSGPIVIEDFELAGGVETVRIGGQYGDTGWQIPGSGLILRDNAGAETVRRIHSHHHPLDGVIIDGLDRATGRVRLLSQIRADANGRQGCSLVGGRGYRFADCSFSRTGRSRIASSPGAGFDVEAEGGKRVRDIQFDRCRFIDNVGVGLVADSGDSADIRVNDCLMVGTTNWSAWPRKPGFRFARSRFVGALCNAFGDADPARAAQFVDCRFDDDHAASPTGRIYGGAGGSAMLADLSSEQNMLFDRCRFTARTGTALPWSTGAIYKDCIMTQGQTPQGYPRGTFVGRNTITGNVDLAGSRILGPIIVNGRRSG